MNEPQELVILSREESGVRKKQILRRFAPQNDKLFVGIAIRESRSFDPLRMTNSFLTEFSVWWRCPLDEVKISASK
jgi:hypothetical protein